MTSHHYIIAAYVHGSCTATWGEVYTRIKKFSSALVKIGVNEGDVVSIIAPNTPSIFEAHFAVPGCRGVLHTINTRLDAKTIAFQLNHAETKVLMVDTEFGKLVKDALELLPAEMSRPLIIDIQDPEFTDDCGELCGDGVIKYEEFLASGDDGRELLKPNDEWDAIGLSYTSGSTGNPKGVVNPHRGAYLNAIANAFETNIGRFAQYLWIVPLFHCNGWCFAWTMAAIAGTSYFVRQVRGDAIIDVVNKYQVRYICGAPVVMNIILSSNDGRKFNQTVKYFTAGAPPPPSVIKRFQDEMDAEVLCGYGLTETHGISSFGHPDPIYADLPEQERLAKGNHVSVNVLQGNLEVYDPKTMKPVPADGETMGEVVFRGNVVMKGYLDNPKATEEAFEGGWFRSGDLGVAMPNGRIALKDRSKDIIISGGENISTIEVETILLTHPAVSEIAVVAMPDEKWGEVPCAFVILHPHFKDTSDSEILSWARTKMPGFMTPKRVIFSELPKTSTGKIQKHELRKQLAEILKIDGK